MTRIRIMCDQTDGTTIKLGTIQSDETGDTLYSAHPRHVPGHHHPRPIALDRPSRTIQPNHQPTRQGRRHEHRPDTTSVERACRRRPRQRHSGRSLRHRIHPRPQRCARARHPHRTSHHSHAPHPDELDLLALALWEANGERPTVYESGKASPTTCSNGGSRWPRAHGALSTERRQCSEKERQTIRRRNHAHRRGQFRGARRRVRLGEQAQLGEQEAQTVTQEVRHTGDVKRLCLTVKTGGRIDAITCQVLDDMTGALS